MLKIIQDWIGLKVIQNLRSPFCLIDRKDNYPGSSFETYLSHTSLYGTEEYGVTECELEKGQYQGLEGEE